MDSIYNADGKVVEYDGSTFCVADPVVVWSADGVYILTDTSVSQVSSMCVPASLYGQCRQYRYRTGITTFFPSLSIRKGFTLKLCRFEQVVGDNITPSSTVNIRGVVTPNGISAAVPIKETTFVESGSEVLAEALDQAQALTFYSSFFISGLAYTAPEVAQSLMSLVSMEYQLAELSLCGWRLYYPVPFSDVSGELHTDDEQNADILYFALLSPLEIHAYSTALSWQIDDYASQGIGPSLTSAMAALAAMEQLFFAMVFVHLMWVSSSYIKADEPMLYFIPTLFVNPVAQWSDAFSASPAVVSCNVGYAAPYYMMVGRSLKVLQPSDCDGGSVVGIQRVQIPSGFSRSWTDVTWSGVEEYEEEHLLYQVNTLFPEDFIFNDGFVLARANYRDIHCSNCVDGFCTASAGRVCAQVGLLRTSPTPLPTRDCAPYSVWKLHIRALEDTWNKTLKITPASILAGTHSYGKAGVNCADISTLQLAGKVDRIENAIPTGVCISTPLREVVVNAIKAGKVVSVTERNSSFTRVTVDTEEILYFTVALITNAFDYQIIRREAGRTFNLCQIPCNPGAMLFFLPIYNDPYRGWFISHLLRSGDDYTQEVRLYRCKVRIGGHFKLNIPSDKTITMVSPDEVEIMDIYFDPDTRTVESVLVYPFIGKPCLVKSYQLPKTKLLVFHTDRELVYVQSTRENADDPEIGTVVKVVDIPSPPAPIYAIADMEIFERNIQRFSQLS